MNLTNECPSGFIYKKRVNLHFVYNSIVIIYILWFYLITRFYVPTSKIGHSQIDCYQAE